jgi:4'-phosphopantetheinyl transferase
VWWARATDVSPPLRELLDPAEGRRLAAFQRQADGDRFTVGRALLRLALVECLGLSPQEVNLVSRCGLCGAPHGKPRLTHRLSPVELSISHSGDRVVVAFMLGTPVGVDVEQFRPDLPVDELVGKVLSAPEERRLRRWEPACRMPAFLTSWTRKEAVVKATGEGIRADLRSIEVSGLGEPARLLAWAGSPASLLGISLHDLAPGRGYVASLAVLGRCQDVLVRDGSELLASWSVGRTGREPDTARERTPRP